MAYGFNIKLDYLPATSMIQKNTYYKDTINQDESAFSNYFRPCVASSYLDKYDINTDGETEQEKEVNAEGIKPEAEQEVSKEETKPEKTISGLIEDTSNYFVNEGDKVYQLNSDNVNDIFSKDQMDLLSWGQNSILDQISDYDSVCKVSEYDDGTTSAIIECRDKNGKLVKSISVNDDNMYIWNYYEEDGVLKAECAGSRTLKNIEGKMQTFFVANTPDFGGLFSKDILDRDNDGEIDEWHFSK